MKKKGQVFEQFGSLATGIAALAILLVVAFLIMSQGKEVVVGEISATTFTHETQTGITFEVFTGYTRCIDDEGMSIAALYPNATGSDTINVNNATIVLNTINFSNKSGDFTGAGPTGTFNLTYSCKEPDEAYNSTEELQNATDDIPTWVPIIVITFIGMILLGLVALLKRTSGTG